MGLVFTLAVSMKQVGREERLIERESETNATRQKDGWRESDGDGQEKPCWSNSSEAAENANFIVHLSDT